MSEEKKRLFIDTTKVVENIEEKKDVQGGWFYRDVGLNDFIKKVEADPRSNGKVVGIVFDGKNVELVTG